ncbi:hypothetical protein VPH35_005042 [Triticum aestivum]
MKSSGIIHVCRFQILRHGHISREENDPHRPPQARPSGSNGGGERGLRRQALAALGAVGAARGNSGHSPAMHLRRRGHHQEQADLHEEENQEGTEVTHRHGLGCCFASTNSNTRRRGRYFLLERCFSSVTLGLQTFRDLFI